ncbi:MAG: hypothetical protein QOG30_3142 [Acidimicrobiaceae bacterium]
MAAVLAVSIDALRGDDARALDDGELRERLLECGRLRAQLDAAEAALLAEFDARGCFLLDGAVNSASWLAHHTGVGRDRAGGRVQFAKRLRRMPLVAEAMAAGLVTESHAQVLRRCLTPRTEEAFARDEAMLVAAAIGVEADELAHTVSEWLLVNDPDGPDPGGEKPSEVHVSPLLDGRTRVDGELDLEDSIEFLAELEAVYDELWHQDQAARLTDPDKFRTVSQRKAAALVEIARRSSAAGDRDADPDDEEQSQGSKGRPRIPQFLVVVDVPPLNGDPTGRAHLEDGTPVSQELLSEWLCDCTMARVVLAGRSLTLDSGQLVYSPSPAQRRALIARDGGCIVPGCRRKARWCQAHHVTFWPEGPTNLKNLVLLCKRHHKQVHKRIINIVRDPSDGFIVTRPDGSRLFERPPPTLVA